MNATPFAARVEDTRPFCPDPMGEDSQSPAWGPPDMSMLRANRSPAAPFPGDVFGSLWPLVQDLAAGAGSPVDYVATGILSVVASLVGAKRWVTPWAGWEEPCVLWVACVGDPSSNKSPAIDAAILPLRGMELDLAEQHKAALMGYATIAERASAETKLWQDKVKEAAKSNLATPSKPDAAEAPDAPQRKRLMVQDSTPEEMAAILSGNPNGTLHLRDELAGWLDSFERYTAGGRAFWLEAYGGRQFVVDRKSLTKPLVVPFNGVSVLGGIQPDKLRDTLLNASDDGLAARFLWSWPEPIRYRRPQQVADRGRLDMIYRQLERLRIVDETVRALPLSTEAASMFEQWIDENDSDVRDNTGLYAALLGKLRGRVLRLALVLEMLAWADRGGVEPVTVSTATLTKAMVLVEDYLKPHARRTFGDAALPQVDKDAREVARFIVKAAAERVNARDMRRDPAIGFNDSSRMDAAVEALEEAGWLRAAPLRIGGTAGRGRKDYLVNPSVHGGASA
jgi:hypothetical protein